MINGDGLAEVKVITAITVFNLCLLSHPLKDVEGEILCKLVARATFSFPNFLFLRSHFLIFVLFLYCLTKPFYFSLYDFDH